MRFMVLHFKIIQPLVASIVTLHHISFAMGSALLSLLLLLSLLSLLLFDMIFMVFLLDFCSPMYHTTSIIIYNSVRWVHDVLLHILAY